MNSQGSITLDQESTSYRPYDPIRGSVTWQLDSAPKSLELRLFWFTSGSGTAEAGVAEVQSLPSTTQGHERFSFNLPGFPYSLRGQLIEIHWALELVGQPHGQLALSEFSLAPDGKVAELPAVHQPKSPWWKTFAPNR